MTSNRDRMIAATCHLIELQGYQATGLNQILAESSTPKGSLYHYFPEGKDELIEAAIKQTAETVEQRLEAAMAAVPHAKEAIPGFIRQLAHQVHAANYQAGGPITAVSIEAASTNPRLSAACREAYQSWQAVLERKLLADEYPAVRAQRLARLVIALIEGSIILSRSEQNVTPLLDAATEIEQLL